MLGGCKPYILYLSKPILKKCQLSKKKTSVFVWHDRVMRLATDLVLICLSPATLHIRCAFVG